jgi:hypothetical protein
LRSPLHGILSKNFLLINFTGRKSGRVFTTPVSYSQDDSAALQNLLKSVYDRKLFGSCFIERCLKSGLTCSPQA